MLKQEKKYYKRKVSTKHRRFEFQRLLSMKDRVTFESMKALGTPDSGSIFYHVRLAMDPNTLQLAQMILTFTAQILI